MAQSVYIHIPFCKSKCYYCSFVSYPKLELKNEYLSTIQHEIKSIYKGEFLKTLYFGGGTPSLLKPNKFNKIIKLFKINSKTEITAELNPDGIDGEGLTYDYLKELKNTGINRISIGAQTFDDNILRQINRRHNSAQIIQAIDNAKKAGFDNISLDFIYGLPNQTLEMFLGDLEKAVNLEIQHISLYGLSIENGSYFYSHRPQNIADDNMQAQMYKNAVEFLISNGFEHYEISNFAKDKKYSKHNLNYWNNNEYYAFGTASHGYLNNFRYSHPDSIEDYIKNPLNYCKEYTENPTSKLEEEIFLGLRKIDGIEISSINSKYNIDFERKYSDILKKYTNLKLMKKTSKGYALTIDGILLSNTILSDFLETV